MRFDMESQHLQRLARMVCLLGTADVSLCLSRWGDGPGHSYPPYPPLYADLDERTFYRDKKLAEKVLYKGECVLVEVKAATSNVKSTKTILRHPEKYHVHHAIKLGDYNVGRNGQILTLPLYMAFLLRSM